MEKDELMRPAQHDHRKGDERERWLQQKVLHDVSGVTTLAMLIIGLLFLRCGAIGGQITVFGAAIARSPVVHHAGRHLCDHL